MADPYVKGIIPKGIYYKRTEVYGKIVVVMDAYLKDRGLHLIKQPTRVFKKHDVVELIVTEEKSDLGHDVHSIAYIGFVEIKNGGVVKRGDQLTIDGIVIGNVLGFDETHMPNHMNLVITVERKQSGKELEIVLGDEVIFSEKQVSLPV